nr:hypothetical protein [Tanacetum cinerariifolium]
MMDDESNQGRMIAKMDQDVVLKDDKEEDKKVADDKEEDKGLLMLLKMLKRLRELHAELNKYINWDEAIDHVKLKAKEDPALDYFKGMSYDDIRPIFEAKFNSNVDFLLKTKDQIEEEETRALQTINETPAERAAKRRKLNEDVEDLKRHLYIVPNEDDDVYTEATPLARKVPVVDYETIEMNNKPNYKLIRADGTYQFYISFLTLLRNFDREDLEALWSLPVEESKNYTWSSKGQELEATRIMWCANHNLYNHAADFVSGKETTASRRPARMMVEYILHQAQKQDLDQANENDDDGNDGGDDDDGDGNDDDNQEYDDTNDDDKETDNDRTESDIIKIPILNQSSTEYYEEEEEKIDDEENMDEE